MVVPLNKLLKRSVALPNSQEISKLSDADGRMIVRNGKIGIFEVEGYLVVEVEADSLHLPLFGLDESDGGEDLAAGSNIIHLK